MMNSIDLTHCGLSSTIQSLLIALEQWGFLCYKMRAKREIM